MSEKSALIIAVETYNDQSISLVQYAERDAEQFGEAIKQHGYLDQKILLSDQATKTTIETQIRRRIQRLTPEDEFLFYYAGHGFSNKSRNFITCFDTDPSDLDETSVGLQNVLELIERSRCKHVVLFLDSCESGITKLQKARGFYGSLSTDELDGFFKQAEYRVCFSACKTNEESYSAGALKHGIWTYHIIEALNGDAPSALENRNRLTANSLQNYLSAAVPKTLRKTFTDPVVQTPWKYGGHNRDFQIADLTDILQARKRIKPGFEQVKRVFLRESDSLNIRSLTGFVKTNHQVPKYVNQATKDFVERIAKKDVEQRADEVFAAVRKHLKYKRTAMEYEDGRILTSDFEYRVWCEQDGDDPEMAVLVEELRNIKPSMINDDRFNNVFEGHFTQLVFEFPKKLSMSDLIDVLESTDRDDMNIDYPKDNSSCEVTFKETELTLTIKGHELLLNLGRGSSPRELLQGLFDARKFLTGTQVDKMLTS